MRRLLELEATEVIIKSESELSNPMESIKHGFDINNRATNQTLQSSSAPKYRLSSFMQHCRAGVSSYEVGRPVRKAAAKKRT